MKLKGKVLQGPKPVECKIHRDGDDFTFICGPVLSFDEFLRLAPEPKPPIKTIVGKGKVEVTDDARYLLKVEAHNQLRIAYMMVKSISFTPELEWSTVKLDNPDTWLGYKEDLQSVLTQAEFNKLISAVFEANNPTEQKRKEALENFTSTEGNPQDTPSLQQEQ